MECAWAHYFTVPLSVSFLFFALFLNGIVLGLLYCGFVLFLRPLSLPGHNEERCFLGIGFGVDGWVGMT